MKIKQVELIGEDPGAFLEGEEVRFVENGAEVKVDRVLADDDESIEPGDTTVLVAVGQTDYRLGFGLAGKVTLDGQEKTAYEDITRGESKLWVIE